MADESMTEEEANEQRIPWVCPGCYAVGGEPCAPFCIDAEIAWKREQAELYETDDRYPED
jgi:hypothetical protein